MLVFLDFEASSLARHSYPIEVAWIFEDGISETHLIRPAPGWDDWDAGAEAIHHIPRDALLRDGMPHDMLARRMMTVLAGHDVVATAPSWDGKWLSVLLRAAGLPRHSLRLRDTEEAQRDTAHDILQDCIAADRIDAEIETLIACVRQQSPGATQAHRALADAVRQRDLWLAVRAGAEQLRDAFRQQRDTFVAPGHE